MRFTLAFKMVAAAGAGALTVVAGVPAFAGAAHRGDTPAIRTVADKLEGPFGLDVLNSHAALVAESGSGKVTAINLKTGAKTTLISGIPGVAGVAAWGGKIFAVRGGPNEMGPTPPSKYPPSSLIVADWNGKNIRVLANLEKYELKHNPDGQKQFDAAGKPFDALSNPFSMIATKWGLLVADGGANDVLRVDPHTGKVSTFFVPSNPRTKECLAKGAQANPGTVGCDPVPTGVFARGNSVYVSTLGAEKPGASVIYKLDGRSGKVQHKWTGFTSLTGVAVSDHGTIFASEVLFGLPAGPPPANLDPSKIGRLTRIDHGKVTHAAVATPTGIDFKDGKLYSTSGSLAGMFGVKAAGKVVQVNSSAFR
ncbi:ScyD/ScyE family protein [Actinoplanes solisilvae]|uniref:ScyD/ScyE family protein n=1 Tax=Actinoplanes solisilvae TaxID=2486853 RepID=UPI0013E2CA8F|nr:ScyD/ScyE family protein [Actinoplanes solisilvae]